MSDGSRVLRPVDFDPFAPGTTDDARLPLTEPQAEMWTAAAMGPRGQLLVQPVLRTDASRPAARRVLAAPHSIGVVARHDAIARRHRTGR